MDRVTRRAVIPTGSAVRHFHLTPPFQDVISVIMLPGHPAAPDDLRLSWCVFVWQRSQVVRQGSAKPRFGSSNLPAASILFLTSARKFGIIYRAHADVAQKRNKVK